MGKVPMFPDPGGNDMHEVWMSMRHSELCEIKKLIDNSVIFSISVILTYNLPTFFDLLNNLFNKVNLDWGENFNLNDRSLTKTALYSL